MGKVLDPNNEVDTIPQREMSKRSHKEKSFFDNEKFCVGCGKSDDRHRKMNQDKINKILEKLINAIELGEEKKTLELN